MRVKNVCRYICGFMTVVAFTACTETNIEGRWLETVPGTENETQGISLEKGGKASSINMETLKYEAWKEKDNMLILSGKSIGNHETTSFSDTLIIEGLTADKLTLKKGSLMINYQRQK